MRCGEMWWKDENLCRRCEYEKSSRGPRRVCARPGCEKKTSALSGICDRCQQYLLQTIFSHYQHGIDLFSNAFDDYAGIALENQTNPDEIPKIDPFPQDVPTYCSVCTGTRPQERIHPTDALNKVLTDCGVIVRTYRFSDAALKVLLSFFSAVMEVLKLVANQRR